ncbi:UNVERIFIED_CONTAM: hypothetical protein FKN15_063202 [Acipenser sinensis]
MPSLLSYCLRRARGTEWTAPCDPGTPESLPLVIVINVYCHVRAKRPEQSLQLDWISTQLSERGLPNLGVVTEAMQCNAMVSLVGFHVWPVYCHVRAKRPEQRLQLDWISTQLSERGLPNLARMVKRMLAGGDSCKGN